MTTMTNETSKGRIARLAAVLATTAVVFGLVTAGASAAPQGPAGAKFYAPPAAKLKGPHGKLVWQRNAPSWLKVDGSAQTKLVLYTSKDAKGKTVGVSGMVALPKGKPPKGGFPVVNWAHGTTGLADACAPSKATVGDTSNAGYIAYQTASISQWVKAGYAVEMTDYQGLGTPGLHQYLVGLSEGRSQLDIIPASHTLFPGKLSNKYAIAGHSQGGHSALWATGIAKSWVKKDKLVGTAAFAPASNVSSQAHAINAYSSPNGISGLAVQIIKGASTQMNAPYDITDVLNSRLLDASDTGLAIGGRSFWDAIDYVCSGTLGSVAADGTNGIAAADLLGSYDSATGGVFDDATVRELDRVLVANNPLFTNVKTPVWVPHGDADTTVLPLFTNGSTGIVAQLNNGRGNTQVSYQSYLGLTHTTVVTDPGVEADFLAKLADWF